MGFNLLIDISRLMKEQKNNPCQKKGTPYEIASCLINQITNKIELHLLAKKYRRLGVESSTRTATIVFSDNKTLVKIKQILIDNPLTALVGIETEKEELVEMEAILKKIEVPSKYISLTH